MTINIQILLRYTAALALASLLGACTQKNTSDDQAQSAAASAPVALGVDRFLLFPNPIGTDPFAQNGGAFETADTSYATAYYRAIDPGNAKDTIDKWRTKNGFTGYATLADPARPGTEHLAVFRDVKDLGYGRRMTARRNSDDGSVAFYVENYKVSPGPGVDYSSQLNVEVAIRRDTQWHVGTNAIEWTTATCTAEDPADCGTGVGTQTTVKFAKYYNFSSADGTRQLAVDLDGRGLKAMPGPCITCHGGRGDPLTPQDASGKPRFPLVENLPSRKRGDVGAHLHGQNVDSFAYSTTQPGFSKSDQQRFLTDFNQWILCTYPSATPGTIVNASPGGTPWGSCARPTAGANEWQGTAAEVIQSWYGGPAMTGTFSDTYVPSGWTNNNIPGTTFTEAALYTNVVAPYCRTCHILRGTKNQDELDFMSFAKFQSYADRIKVHVFDRGNMPLSLIPHTDFWNSSAPQMLASFIDAQPGAGPATANGAVLMPGRPIADPGPNRMVKTGANAVLTGENSLFASTFAWSEPTPSGNVTITNPTGMVAIFNASVAGTYVVRLTVNNGPFKDVNITVDDNFPDPLNIKFAHVKNVLQNVLHGGTAHCIDCHTSAANVVTATRVPPIWYTNFDRDGSGGAANTTDDEWFLKAIQGRVNLTEIGASPLLRKPTGNHHNGLKVIDTADTSTDSAGGLRNYSILYNWILAGMQPGGVAANPVVPAASTLTFSGSPLFSPDIALAGGSSIGASNFFWTVTGPSGPTGAVPIISNPTSASAVLNVPNAGPYVVRLHVDDGITSDVVQRTITVTEPAINANFNPQTGSVTVTSPSLGRGNIILSSQSTYTGVPVIIPVNCRWQVLSGPAGALLDGSVLLDVTKSCATDAILNVPTSAAGLQYNVQLTASTVGTSAPVAHQLTISNSAPAASLASTSTLQSLQFSQTSSVLNTTHTNPTAPGGTAGTVSVPVVTAGVSLSGASSTTPTGTLTYSWCVLAGQQPDATNFPASFPVCPTKTAASASPATTMTVGATGGYGVQLTVDNGFNTATASTTVTVRPLQLVSFPSIVSTVTCGSSCHLHTPASAASSIFNPPTPSGGNAPPWDNVNTLEGLSLYRRLIQRVNLVTPTASRLLTCPQSGCGGMGGYAWTPGTNPYDDVRKWIQDGAPPGN